MMMSAADGGELIGSRATAGFSLAFKADALSVGAASDLLDGPTGRLNASEAGVTRVRTALEGFAGLHSRRRPAVADAERRGESAPGRRRGGDERRHGRRRRPGLHRHGHGAVARRAGADAARAPGRRVHRPRDVAVARLGPDAAEPAGADGEGRRVVGRFGAGRGRGAVGATRWPTAWARTRCTGPAVSSGGGLRAAGGCPVPGTPSVGLARSLYGREYQVGYALGVLAQGRVHFELGVDAQRRESPEHGEASNGLMGRPASKYLGRRTPRR